MKTTIQWLKDYLETKVLPCPEGNDYVYGMNVAHNNLIEYMIPYLLIIEKDQLIKAYNDGYKACDLDRNNMNVDMQELIEWLKQYEGQMISADQVILKLYKLFNKEDKTFKQKSKWTKI